MAFQFDAPPDLLKSALARVILLFIPLWTKGQLHSFKSCAGTSRNYPTLCGGNYKYPVLLCQLSNVKLLYPRVRTRGVRYRKSEARITGNTSITHFRNNHRYYTILSIGKNDDVFCTRGRMSIVPPPRPVPRPLVW